MAQFKARVQVMLKKDVLDPQGKAVHHGLLALGFSQVKGVRVGKMIEVEIEAETVEKARDELKTMSEKLLANTVIEKFQVELES